MPTNITGDLYPMSIIDDHFSGLSEEDYLEVQGEAILFLSRETGQSSLNQPIAEQQGSSLKRHLSRYLQQKRRDTFGAPPGSMSSVRSVSDYRNDQREGMSDEEVMSRLSRLAQNTNGDMIDLRSTTSGPSSGENRVRNERTLRSLELRREQLREILPVIEYEALELRTQDEIDRRPRLTLGFEQIGLQMLFRRACIRLLWDTQKTK